MTVVEGNPRKAGDTSYKIKPTPYLMHASQSVAGQFGTSNRLFASIPSFELLLHCQIKVFLLSLVNLSHFVYLPT